MVDPKDERTRWAELEKAVEHAINCHSRENVSDTPDWILANYMMASLIAFECTVKLREKWYGRKVGGGAAICTPTENPPGAPLEDIPTKEELRDSICREMFECGYDDLDDDLRKAIINRRVEQVAAAQTAKKCPHCDFDEGLGHAKFCRKFVAPEQTTDDMPGFAEFYNSGVLTNSRFDRDRTFYLAGFLAGQRSTGEK
jgi:hypothetical protein